MDGCVMQSLGSCRCSAEAGTVCCLPAMSARHLSIVGVHSSARGRLLGPPLRTVRHCWQPLAGPGGTGDSPTAAPSQATNHCVTCVCDWLWSLAGSRARQARWMEKRRRGAAGPCHSPGPGPTRVSGTRTLVGSRVRHWVDLSRT